MYYYPTSTPALPYYFNYLAHNAQRSTSVRGLARYTLTRQSAHHMQFDVLGGFTLDYQRTHYTSSSTDTDSLQTVIATKEYDERYHHTNFLLTGGLSTRYHFGRHLEVVLDVTLSRSFLRGEFSGFPGSTALGLRYRFGQR